MPQKAVLKYGIFLTRISILRKNNVHDPQETFLGFEHFIMTKMIQFFLKIVY